MSEARFQPVSVALLGVFTFMAAVTFLVAAIGGSYALTLHAIRTAEQAQVAAQQSEAKAGRLINAKLCRSLDALAALAPPGPADVAKGKPYPPSFVYEDNLHAILSQLKPDIGCSK